MAAPGHDAVMLDDRALRVTAQAIYSTIPALSMKRSQAVAATALSRVIDDGYRLVTEDQTDALWAAVGTLRQCQRDIATGHADASTAEDLHEIARLLARIVKGNSRGH